MVTRPPSTLDRRGAVAALLEGRTDVLVVSGLGSTTYDCHAAGDHPANFYLWGAMGGAAVMGLGLAYAQPRRRVLVITGDGEMLMGLGSLATIGVQAPGNLALGILDNERSGETGMQETATAHGVDLAATALACRFRKAAVVRTESDFAAALEPIRTERGPLLYQVKVRADKLPLVVPPREGAHLKTRFRERLLGPRAFA